jgi:anti-sigma factor RsiW
MVAKNELAGANEFDADDARLSAYVLGELEESERAQVEALLERDPRAAKFVEELRATMAQVERALAGADVGASELSGAQRAQVLERASEPRGSRSPRRSCSPAWVERCSLCVRGARSSRSRARSCG